MPNDELTDVFLGRQPILDRQQQLHAYELLFRDGGASDAAGEENHRARYTDGNLATATVISNAFSEFSMGEALGPYQGYIKVDAGLLCSDLINALPPSIVVLEIVDSVAATAAIVERCAQLRAAGFTLAVRLGATWPEVAPSVLAGASPAASLLEQAGVIKIDVSHYGAPHLTQIVDGLRPLGKTLLAEKVESHAQMQFCHELGFDLFQGYYFARPTLLRGKHLHPSELALLRLLGLLGQDADDEAIEDVFRQAPLLTVNLLRLINSASSAVTTRVTSLRHAISLLGRRQLLRWLQLLLYSSLPQAQQTVNPLLQRAATRGRLMELLVARVSDAQINARQRESVDQAYMTGILSLMPTLFACSMNDLLAQLPVAAPVADALGAHGGTLGTLLSLVEALEDPTHPTHPTHSAHPAPEDAADPAAAKTQAIVRALPGLDAAGVNASLSSALNWANNLARTSF